MTISPSDRYELFKYYYDSDTTSQTEESEIFKANSFEIRHIVRIKYPEYVAALKTMELEDREVKIKSFSDAEKKIIIECFPLNFFLNDIAIDDLAISNYFSKAKASFDAANMDSANLLKRLQNFMQKSPQIANEITCVQISGSSKSYKITEVNEFYNSKLFFDRDCYKQLFDVSIKAAKSKCVAIIGDPGIGKSTLAGAIFSHFSNNEKSNDEGFKRVFWAMESGTWIFFDGTNVTTGSYLNEVWKCQDVLLLIDGSFKDPFLSKRKNCILFCSPDRSNYHKWIKMGEGRVFVMPPWSLQELENFFDSIPDASTDAKPNGLVMYEEFLANLNTLIHECTWPEGRSRKSYPTIEAFSTISPNDYDEVEIYKDLVDASATGNDKLQMFLKDHMRRRFHIVGGKFRFIFNNDCLISELESLVRRCVYAVSEKSLNNVQAIEYSRSAPSILYSMIPLYEPKACLSPQFSFNFSSRFILECVSNKLISGSRDDFVRFFTAMKNHRIEGSLIGKIFEDSVHKYFLKTSFLDVKIRDVTGNISRFQHKIVAFSYDSNNNNLKDLITSECNMYLFPNQMNAPAIDSILRLHTGEFYFFQVTIANSHPVKKKHLDFLCTSLGIPLNQVNLVFLVLESSFADFPIQNIVSESGKRLNSPDSPLVKSQLVAYIDDINEMARFFEVNNGDTTSSSSASKKTKIDLE